MKIRRLLIIATAMLTASVSGATEAADTLHIADAATEIAADTANISLGGDEKVSSTLWIRQLIRNGFHINDPGVQYPKFPRFLLKVYNWGDRVFNSYDPEYVEGTGKNWKLQGKVNNWMQNYTFIFPRGNNLHILSDFYSDIGGNLSFMAVSVGYMFNANELINDRHDTRTYFNFNFTCALFTADYTHTTTVGGAHITRFGKVFEGHSVHIPLENLENSSTTAQAFYFFNHRKYSHAAATCYSKYQLKSAGSWVAGFSYNRQDVNIDLGSLLPEMEEEIPELVSQYHFNYTDWLGMGGYSYNWVLKPRRWLINVMPTVGIGYKHTNASSTDGRRDMVASSFLMNLSVVYNHRALFCAIQTRGQGWFYFNGNYTFLNGFLTVFGTVGIRF